MRERKLIFYIELQVNKKLQKVQNHATAQRDCKNK